MMIRTVLGRKLQIMSLVATLMIGAIAPLSQKIQAEAAPTDTVKACDQEALMLPTHPDVQTLDRLYQRYLGMAFVNADLGVSPIDFALGLQAISQRLDDLNLSSADRGIFDQLNLKYQDAIAKLKTHDDSASQESYGLFGQRNSTLSKVARPMPAVPIITNPVGQPASVSQSDQVRVRPSLPPVPLASPALREPPLDVPPNFNTEEYARIDDNPFFVPAQVPLSTFSIDVDTASYSNVRRFLKQGQLPPKDAVRLEELINYFDYDYTEPTADQPFSINTEVAQAPWNRDHKLVQIGLKGRELQTRQPSNLVFLVDVSGSMQSPNKLQLLQRSMCMLVREMKPEDHVTLVTYAGNAGLVLPPTSGRQKNKILEAIANLEAGGSTAGAAGINLAYDMAQKHFLRSGNNRVILATDGDFNVGISSNAELERLIETKRDRGIFLTVLGFGTGNYKDSKMETLADKGNGNYAYIDTLAEARKVLVEDLTGTLFTIAKDVKIQVEFNPQQVKAYRLIGYENRLLRDQDFNDDQKDAGEIGAGHTITALYEIIPQGLETPIPLPSVDDLKYQQPAVTSPRANSNELMQVKLRYKEPTANTSQLLTQAIAAQEGSSNLSADLKFASAVAMFGMLLRDQPFHGRSSYPLIRAQVSELKSRSAYQNEFLALVEKAEKIDQAMKEKQSLRDK